MENKDMLLIYANLFWTWLKEILQYSLPSSPDNLCHTLLYANCSTHYRPLNALLYDLTTLTHMPLVGITSVSNAIGWGWQ